MRNFLVNFASRYIVPYVFRFSDQPMLFIELLQANKNFDDGVDLEKNIQGFRVRLGRMYIVFGALWNIFVFTVSGIIHFLLVHIDCHILILLSIVLTIIFFAAFAIFKATLIELVSKRLIQKAWKNHFPHFAYADYHLKVTQAYSEALEHDIPKKELQLFIINKIVEE